jgi:tetratricopeptide (TPR) repeat protein
MKPAIRNIFVSVLLFLITGFALAGSYSEYKTGMESLSSGDLVNARSHLLEAKEKYPHAYYLLGVIAEKQGVHQDAIGYFNQFQNYLSEDNELFFPTKAHLAYCFASLKNESSSVDLLHQLDKTVFDKKSVALIYADASLVLADWTRKSTYAVMAKEKYSLVYEKLDTQSAEAFNGYARACILVFDIQTENKKHEQKQLIDGLSAICKAIKIKRNGYYFINEGVIYYKMKDWDSSAEAFRNAIVAASNDEKMLEKARKNLRHVEAMMKSNPRPKITPVRCE